MADEADRAQLKIELQLVHARLAAQARTKLISIGHCHNCDEHLERKGQLFCEQQCAEDFEKRERELVLRGG